MCVYTHLDFETFFEGFGVSADIAVSIESALTEYGLFRPTLASFEGCNARFLFLAYFNATRNEERR